MRFRVYGLVLSKRAYFCQAWGGRLDRRNNRATGSSKAPGSIFSVFLRCTASGIRSTKSCMLRILPLSFSVRSSPNTPGPAPQAGRSIASVTKDPRSGDSDAREKVYGCTGVRSWGGAADEKPARGFGNLPGDSTGLLPRRVVFLVVAVWWHR